MAPRPKRIDGKYVEPVRSLNQPGMKLHPLIQLNIGVVAVTARPPSSAPPGRRMPKVTTTASQSSPVIGVAEVFVNEPFVTPSITPPNPAIAAENAKSVISLRAGATPEVRAATSELRTASAARPDADRCRLWIISVIRPKTTSSPMICVRGCEKSNVVMPGTCNDGNRNVHPSCPLLTSSAWKTVRSSASASASDPSASASTPSLRIGIAINAPTAAATAVPMIAATAKLICPWFAMSGTLMPKSWLSAQPAMKPPAVTNVPWARLTIPPCPVTTTKDRKTIAIAMPGASTPSASKSSAWAQPHGSHCRVNATNARITIAHGSNRRHRGRPARWSTAGFSSDTVRAAARVRPMKTSRMTVRMKGIDGRNPDRSLMKLGSTSYP